jgi:hypothetical protein
LLELYFDDINIEFVDSHSVMVYDDDHLIKYMTLYQTLHDKLIINDVTLYSCPQKITGKGNIFVGNNKNTNCIKIITLLDKDNYVIGIKMLDESLQQNNIEHEDCWCNFKGILINNMPNKIKNHMSEIKRIIMAYREEIKQDLIHIKKINKITSSIDNYIKQIKYNKKCSTRIVKVIRNIDNSTSNTIIISNA